MSIADDPKYVATSERLIHAEAESVRLEAEELRAAGFATVQVVGMASVIWWRAGRFYTTESALQESRAIPRSKENP